MLRLYVLRHAKSSWAEPGTSDFDRGLNGRGETDLPRIAAAMRDRRYLPAHIYCSPATRARLTLHGVMAAFDEPPTITYVDSLYSGEPSDYLDCLRTHPVDEPLMIVGHNPMCAAFAMSLAGSGDPDALVSLAAKYPTGALAVFDIDRARWAELEPGSGHLVDFVLPREMPASR